MSIGCNIQEVKQSFLSNFEDVFDKISISMSDKVVLVNQFVQTKTNYLALGFCEQILNSNFNVERWKQLLYEGQYNQMTVEGWKNELRGEVLRIDNNTIKSLHVICEKISAFWDKLNGRNEGHTEYEYSLVSFIDMILVNYEYIYEYKAQHEDNSYLTAIDTELVRINSLKEEVLKLENDSKIC